MHRFMVHKERRRSLPAQNAKTPAPSRQRRFSGGVLRRERPVVGDLGAGTLVAAGQPTTATGASQALWSTVTVAPPKVSFLFTAYWWPRRWPVHRVEAKGKPVVVSALLS